MDTDRLILTKEKPGSGNFTVYFFFLLLLYFISPVFAWEFISLEQSYTKKEYRIPMRDGVALFTAVYIPKDSLKQYPFLICRTPYSVGPYGENNFPSYRADAWEHLAREGFIFVYQDVRGRFMSEGKFVNMRPYIPNKTGKKQTDESSDTYDTVDWLVKNIPNNNGRAGIWGISYPGFYAAMGLMDAHPALVAASPQAPLADWFIGDDFHHNGALNITLAMNFFPSFGLPRKGLTTIWPAKFDFGTSDGYKFFLETGPLKNINKLYLDGKIPFWNDLMKHDTYDEFWQSRSTLKDYNQVSPAVMTVGGWFDAEDCFGALKTYQTIEKKNPGSFNILVMGPWFHGGWVRSDGDRLGDISFAEKTGEFYKDNIELPFFKFFLKDEGQLDLPEAFVFATGENQWYKFDRWPPENIKNNNLYLQPENKLSFESPSTSDLPGFDEYLSDPKNPVPFTAQITTTMPKPFMVEDQRFVSQRPDVLTYQTESLDSSISIIGPVKAQLFVSTSGTDADWVIKLIDVFPEASTGGSVKPQNKKMTGYQMLVRGEIMRGKFRNSYEHPEPFVPNEITRVEFTLNDIFHTFQPGHRIMLQIQSSWFPLFDMNPQKFLDINRASESDFQKAIQRIYHTFQSPSAIEFNILIKQ
jgi:putative CocE/NonD family hydrolase